MEDILNTKIQHYCEYVNLAFENFRNERFSDSAINARKSAEAACKVMFFHSYPKKRAEEKIKDKGLKDLLMTLSRDSLIDRKFINAVEALQIVGNKAAHDNFIKKEEASYALSGLLLLTEYLFSEHLKISSPKNLNFSTTKKNEDSGKEKKPDIIEKIIVQEKIVPIGLDKDSEEALINKIRGLSEHDREKYEELLLKKQEEFEKKLEDLKRENAAAKQEALVSETPKKNKRNRILLFSSGVVALLILAFLFFYDKSDNALLSGDMQYMQIRNSDTINVAINKLEVLQDNPQMDFKIEEIIKKQIAIKAAKANIPVKITITNLSNPDYDNDSAFIKRAANLNFDVLYWGNLYESVKDSNTLEIKGGITFLKAWLRNKKITFKNLTDSSFIKETGDQSNAPLFAYCNKMESNVMMTPVRLAEIMEKAKSYSIENFMTFNIALCRYYLFGKQNLKTLSSADKMISYYPQYSELYVFKAIAYRQLNRYDSAYFFLNKALEIDSLSRDGLAEMVRLDILKRDTVSAKSYIPKLKIVYEKGAKEFERQIADMAKGNLYYSDEYLEANKNADSTFQARDYKSALAWRYKALDQTLHKAREYARIAEYYYELKDIAKAIEAINLAWQQDSTDCLVASFYMQFASILPPLEHKLEYQTDYAVKLCPKNREVLEAAINIYKKSKDYKAAMKVCLMADKDFPRDSVFTPLIAEVAALNENFQLSKEKYEYLYLMEHDEGYALNLIHLYLKLSKGNIKSPEFIRGYQLLDKIKNSPTQKARVSTAIERYLLAIVTASPAIMTDKNLARQFNISESSRLVLKNMYDMRGGSLNQLYSNNTMTVTGNETQNVFIKKFKNGSTQHLTCSVSGLREMSTKFVNGQGVPKGEVFPDDEVFIIAVLENSKNILSSEARRFLQVQHEFYKKRIKNGNVDAKTFATHEMVKKKLANYVKVE